jgi:deoxycytidine triphosphate deaminase
VAGAVSGDQRHHWLALIGCKSGLAREGVITSDLVRAWRTGFASKPAPTDLRTPDISEVAWIDCRSTLAREGVSTSDLVHA